MGRGLSDLQRFILTRAAQQERLYYAEILAEYFGWELRKSMYLKDGKYWSGQFFGRRKIGEAVYHRVMATLSRTCRRLEARGLVQCVSGAYCRWSAVDITDKGRDCYRLTLAPAGASVNHYVESPSAILNRVDPANDLKSDEVIE